MIKSFQIRWAHFSLLALSAGGIIGCSEPSGVDAFAPKAALVTPTPLQQQAQLCVSGAAGTYAFTITETDGNNINTLNGANHVLAADQCVLIATTDAGDNNFPLIARIHITWGGTPSGRKLDYATLTQHVFSDQGATVPFSTTNTVVPGPGADLELGLERAALAVFKFSELAAQGCTPGYWKQSHHFDSWPAAYTPGMQFSAVFENAFPGKTLLQVLSQGGGGLTALGRHTVAALLNGASGITFGMTAAEVIDAFNDEFPGGNYAGLHNTLVALNEAGCPLN